ncbi:MAG: class I SAM-dependent methyltransferase, partial [Anaerolineales bacterium]
VGKSYGRQDAISDVSQLAIRDGCVDVALNTQVLEHVERPEAVLAELYRVLKPGGKLYLSVPQGDPEHEVPYDYYRFTSFGMRYLLKRAGFEIIFVEPRGGYFWYMGNRLRHLPTFIFPAAQTRVQRILRYPRYPLKLACQIIFELVTPLLCFYLDKLDQTKAFTQGYLCYSRKPYALAAGPSFK